MKATLLEFEGHPDVDVRAEARAGAYEMRVVYEIRAKRAPLAVFDALPTSSPDGLCHDPELAYRAFRAPARLSLARVVPEAPPRVGRAIVPWVRRLEPGSALSGEIRIDLPTDEVQAYPRRGPVRFEQAVATSVELELELARRGAGVRELASPEGAGLFTLLGDGRRPISTFRVFARGRAPIPIPVVRAIPIELGAVLDELEPEVARLVRNCCRAPELREALAPAAATLRDRLARARALHAFEFGEAPVSPRLARVLAELAKVLGEGRHA